MSSFAVHQNGDCVGGIHVKQSPPPEYDDCREVNVFPELPSDFYDAGEGVGEPDILPRVGDEYQAELPPLIGELNHMSYSEVEHHSIQDFLIGLSIPLVWIDYVKNEVSDSRNPDYKNMAKRPIFCNGDIVPSHNLMNSEEEMKSSPAEEKLRMCCDGGRLLVPGLLCESWSDAEKASFLLALYIFEKNFIEVRRFVQSKDMGAILSFYYGEFYGSDVYHRWSEGRKTKSKKCVYGQRIFSGLRLQELMFRLFSKVSEECKSNLVKVSKTFSEEKMSFFDYVFSLKAMVGMDLLVEAVAIGSGKQDLTGMALEPLKSNQVIRSEIPAGKACSALTTTEIIKFLSGDYRLSKARSSDLFWEAVWPRLLARGWHSEQPPNQGYVAGSKCLVFLLPGVKKFSRKLVKGDQYFDSVTDVLSKVAKDPALIDLDNEEANVSQNTKKDEWTGDVKMEEDENHPPTRQRHSYLQPRTPKRSLDAIKFTVVDSCLSNGKIRELRTLPREISSTLISPDPREDSDRDSVEENTGESDTTNSITLEIPVGKSGPKKHAGKRNREDNSSSQNLCHIYPGLGKPSAPLKRKKDANDNQKPRKVSKTLSGRKQKQSYVDNIASISKRCRKLSANTHEEARDAVVYSKTPRLENGTSCCSSGVHESNENLSTQVSSCQDKLSSGSSSKSSPCESIECSQVSDVHATEPSQANAQPQLLIDLNIPQVSPEFENEGPATNFPNEPDHQPIQPHGNHGLPAPSGVEASSEQQPIGNTRRLSTRYRPPTTRALEAVAGGYLTVSRRRKGRETSSLDAQPSRPSQQPHFAPCPNESPSSSIASQIGETSQIAEAERGASTSGTSNADNKPNDPPEANQMRASFQTEGQ